MSFSGFPQEAKAELDFWSSNLEVYNAQPIWHLPSTVRVVHSDASETGYGGYVVEHGLYVTCGCWTAEEAARSSTWQELFAVYIVPLSVVPKLVNARVGWLQITRLLDAFCRLVVRSLVCMLLH